MKKIFIFSLCFAALMVQAQRLHANNTVVQMIDGYEYTVNNDTIIACYDSVIAKEYYKDSVHRYTTIIAKTCYDTSTTQIPIYKNDTSWTYTTKNCHKVKTGGFWFWTTYKTVCDTTKTIKSITKVITGYTTSIKTTPYDCSTTSAGCDTFKNAIYVPAVTKKHCDTTYTSSTEFGAKLQGSVDSQLIGHKALLTKWSRTGVILPFMDGKKDNSIIQFLQQGYNVFINLSCNDPRNNPQPWFRDTVQYEKWLRTFFELYKPDFDAYKANGQRIFFGHDNEPLNQNYHGIDSLENYFTLGRTFNKVCHEYGMETADGASFVETIYAMLTGYNTRDANLSFKIYRQRKYITLMKSAGFDLANSHWGINDDSVTDNEAQITTDYLSQQIGIPACSNEYHYYMATTQAGTIAKGVNAWKKTKCQFVIVWDGDHIEGVIINKKDNSFQGSPADMLVTSDGKLTPLGEQYRDAIKP